MIQIYIESKTFHLETVLNHGESIVYCHELPFFFIDNQNYLSCIGHIDIYLRSVFRGKYSMTVAHVNHVEAVPKLSIFKLYATYLSVDNSIVNFIDCLLFDV